MNIVPLSESNAPANGHRLVFPAKQQVSLETFDLPALDDGQVLVRTELSLMSTGTENIIFNRLFDSGTHWDNWVKYPFFPGYCAVGTVIASRSGLFQPGDRVTARAPHQSHSVCAEEFCCPVPDDVPFENALWYALAKIAFHGALVARHRLGDTVLVIGAGPIGQMSIRWARAAGAAVVVAVDAAPERLDLARAGGATAAIAAPIDKAREAILQANGGKLPRVVIDTTGNAKVFEAALGLAAPFGTVVVLGDTGRPAGQHLTPDVVTRGLRIVGAHDGHNTAEWNNSTITGLFLSLTASGRFSLEGLNTHRFPPRECTDAYETANRDRAKTMGIVFDWRSE